MTTQFQDVLHIRDLIPSFERPAANRDQPLGSWQYKQKKSLVILFLHSLGCAPCQQLCQDLAQHYDSYRAADTEILLLLTTPLAALSAELALLPKPWPFPILADADGTVRQRYLGATESGEPTPVGVFICDRYGELYYQAIALEANALPSEPEIRDWATFIDMQCPECFPPEW